MKNLIIGDLHTKTEILKNIVYQENLDEYDKVIFLGDYVDDWGKTAGHSYQLLESLIALKQTYQDKIILLLGNHDLSEWFSGDFICAGYNPITSMKVAELFDENNNYFQIAYSDGKYLYTHAGVTDGWLSELKWTNDVNYPKEITPDSLAEYLNWIWFKKEDDYLANKLFKKFAQVGRLRGGYENPSPLWADKNELLDDYLEKINQIVGHTPVRQIEKFTQRNGEEIYFCDTFSTTRNGEFIGNNQPLIIEEK